MDLGHLSSSLAARIRAPRIPEALRARASGLQGLAASGRSSRETAGSFVRLFLERSSMGWNLIEQEEVERLGVRDYFERQLHPEEIDDYGLEEILREALPTLTLSPWEIISRYYEEPEIPFFELLVATVYRAVYSPRQLFERMVVFFTDHFNIGIDSDRSIWFKATDEREVIRRHALGSFPAMLRGSARSAAMLSYLTNDSNEVGHPNENYARELMELHTLGVDGGYGEQDVKEVARALTGWAFWDYDAGPAFGDFVFRSEVHDFGPKTILGTTLTGSGGIDDGESVLELLANHESTSRFLADKMLRFLWGYEPTESAVRAVSRTYLETDGDIPSMLRESLAWFRVATASPKLKRPYHLMVSSVRALLAELEHPFFLLEMAYRAGHLPYNWSPPNGYPDSEGYWSGFLLPRWNFAAEALTSEDGGIRLTLDELDASRPVEEIVEIFDVLLLGGTMTEATRAVLSSFLTRQPRNRERLGDAAGLVLASPEFQRY